MAFEEGNKLGKKFSSENQPEKNGRPKKLPEIEVLIANVLGEEKDGTTAAEAILMALRAKAAKGDIRAAELLLNRGYGMAKQFIKAEVTENKKPTWFDNIPVLNGVEK